MPLSQKQMEYLALAWQCFETDPKIDYEKFKTVAGLASAASARVMMRLTKKKLKQEYGALSGGGEQASNGNHNVSTPRGTPGSRKRGRKAMAEMHDEDEDDDDDDEEQPATPSKKKRTMQAKKSPKEEDEKKKKKTTTPKKSAVKAEPVDDDYDEEEQDMDGEMV